MRSICVLAISLIATACTAADDGGGTCSTKPGPEMRPGWNCLSCHRAGGQATAKVWTAGGTVYDALDSDPCTGTPEVDVVFFDPQGNEIERVRTNDVGNFYTRAELPEGFLVGLEREGRLAMMPIPPPAGSCNACHADNPVGGALGKIRAP